MEMFFMFFFPFFIKPIPFNLSVKSPSVNLFTPRVWVFEGDELWERIRDRFV